MILMPQIFDVTANENARYKPNELEYYFITYCLTWRDSDVSIPVNIKIFTAVQKYIQDCNRFS